MALKLVINDPKDVNAALRDEYKKGDDGKYHLALEGEHPDSVKLAEFRANNRALNTAKTELEAKLAVVEEQYRALKANPDAAARVTELESNLAAEKVAHERTQFKNVVTYEFLRAGGRESAVDFVVAKAAEVFAMKDGKPTTEVFSEKTPGERLTVEEWVNQQMGVIDFAFKPSRGGGAGSSGGGSTGPRVIPNDPVTVGRNLEAIAKGDAIVG